MGLFKKKQKQATKIYAPVDGVLLPLEEVEDPVFAQKMMGEGIAILAQGGIVKAPADGVISMIAQTSHAFGMKLDNGLELMVHVGLETVNLKGQGFHVLQAVNQRVSAQTPILELDQAYLKAQGISLCTPVILINHQEHPFTLMKKDGNVIAGEDVLFEVV